MTKHPEWPKATNQYRSTNKLAQSFPASHVQLLNPQNDHITVVGNKEYEHTNQSLS